MAVGFVPPPWFAPMPGRVKREDAEVGQRGVHVQHELRVCSNGACIFNIQDFDPNTKMKHILRQNFLMPLT